MNLRVTGTSRGVVDQWFRNVAWEPKEFKIYGPLKLVVAIDESLRTLFSVMIWDYVINQWAFRPNSPGRVYYHQGQDKVDMLVEVEDERLLKHVPAFRSRFRPLVFTFFYFDPGPSGPVDDSLAAAFPSVIVEAS